MNYLNLNLNSKPISYIGDVSIVILCGVGIFLSTIWFSGWLFAAFYTVFILFLIRSAFEILDIYYYNKAVKMLADIKKMFDKEQNMKLLYANVTQKDNSEK